MLTIGIDLAAEPKGTAVAQIDWSQGNARLIELAVGLNDQEIVSLARGGVEQLVSQIAYLLAKTLPRIIFSKPVSNRMPMPVSQTFGQ